MRKLVFGAGLNDADYAVGPRVNGRQIWCPFYGKWHDMLKRCYNKSDISRYPTYADCYVCDEWLTFSKFKAWMEKQDWKGKHLDKDLLVKGNKVYSPDTCVFVDWSVNGFLIDQCAKRGKYPAGVDFNRGMFRSRCQNQFTGKSESLGLFKCPIQAHLAWRKRKHELACKLADLQTDERVANALRVRYL